MIEILAWILAFAIAITIHEAAHAYMADRLGDPTARLMGRLSLNPLVHYDRVGTTLLLVTTIMRALHMPVIPFGWAKPVEFDPYNLKNPRRDSALISFAGPVSNLLIALIASLILRFFIVGNLGLAINLLYPIIGLNVILAIFNLIPVHPLDGGKILVGLLPENEARRADLFMRQYGFVILLFLIFPTVGGSSPVSLIITPVIEFLLNILLPGSSIV